MTHATTSRTNVGAVAQPETARAKAIAATADRPAENRICPVFRDCNDPKPGHFDHSGHDAVKVLDERNTSTVLDAGMVAHSGSDHHMIVYVGVAEFSDLDALKAKTQELRRFLDEVDELGERAFADHQARA